MHRAVSRQRSLQFWRLSWITLPILRFGHSLSEKSLLDVIHTSLCLATPKKERDGNGGAGVGVGGGGGGLHHWWSTHSDTQAPLVVWRSKNSDFSGIKEDGRTVKERRPNWTDQQCPNPKEIQGMMQIDEKGGGHNDWKGNGKGWRSHHNVHCQ